MTTFPGWLQLLLVIFAGGALVGALLVGVTSTRWSANLRQIDPRIRFALLGTLILAPILGGAALLGIAFLPSFLDALNLVRDHCAHHAGHAFHLCFVHGHPPGLSWPILVAASILALWFGNGVVRELNRVLRVRAWGSKLSGLSRFDARMGSWIVPSPRPLAVTAGLFRPQIYVSETLLGLLSSRQLEVVLAHERAHVRRWDGFCKSVMRIAAQFHFPPVRRHLLRELELAAEQACDEAAAESVGDRLTVAETILAVERACASEEMPSGALGFGAGRVERRVHAMVDCDWRAPRWTPLLAAITIVVVAVATSYEAFHHTAETYLSYLF